jgi:hypothetical protein
MSLNESATPADELELDQLAAVAGGGNPIVDAVIHWVVDQVLDAAWEGLKEAGPAPATEHGSIYTVQPAGFVG